MLPETFFGSSDYLSLRVLCVSGPTVSIEALLGMLG